MSRKSQKGFSMLELLVAMMIIAVLATLGFSKFQDSTRQANDIKAKDSMKIVSDGLAKYYLDNGRYPDFGSWEAMVDANSILVKKSLIKQNMPTEDPFHNPYEAKSEKQTFTIKYQGAPGKEDQYPPVSIVNGQTIVEGPKTGEGAPK